MIKNLKNVLVAASFFGLSFVPSMLILTAPAKADTNLAFKKNEEQTEIPSSIISFTLAGNLEVETPNPISNLPIGNLPSITIPVPPVPMKIWCKG